MVGLEVLRSRSWCIATLLRCVLFAALARDTLGSRERTEQPDPLPLLVLKGSRTGSTWLTAELNEVEGVAITEEALKQGLLATLRGRVLKHTNVIKRVNVTAWDEADAQPWVLAYAVGATRIPLVPGWQCLRALLVQANLKAAPWQWRFDAPVETRAKALLLPELPEVDMRVLRTHCGPLSNKRSRGRKHARAERRKSDLPTADNTPLRVVGFTLNLPRVNEAGRPPLLPLGALHGALAARGGGALIVHVRRNVVKTTVSRLLKSAAAESSRCETVNGQVSDKCDVEAVELVPRWGVTDNGRRRKRADKHVARGGEFNRYIVRLVYLETILVDLFDNASFRENAVSFATTLR